MLRGTRCGWHALKGYIGLCPFLVLSVFLDVMRCPSSLYPVFPTLRKSLPGSEMLVSSDHVSQKISYLFQVDFSGVSKVVGSCAAHELFIKRK